MKFGTWAFVLALGSALCLGQEGEVPDPQSGVLREWNDAIMDADQGSVSPADEEDYRIGAEDLVEVSVFEVPELSRTARVSASGEISLPLLGTMRVAGLTTRELEMDLTNRLRGTYLHDPQVSVFMKEFKSDPVSVVGAVKQPGVYQIQSQKTLIELLAMAQGFSEGPIRLPGRSIIVTRSPKSKWRASGNGATGESPVPGSQRTPGESIEIPIKQLIQSGDPQWNIPIYPGDVVKVVPAGTFYVASTHAPRKYALTALAPRA